MQRQPYKSETEKIFVELANEVKLARQRGRELMAIAKDAIARDKRLREASGLEQNQAARNKAIADVRHHAPLQDRTGWTVN